MPESRRVLLRKTAWDTDAYAFDTVLHEASSQTRVFDEVAKPVVEAVLKGYNGTVMAYGQTGTGKTHTMLARGGDDPAARGVVCRAVEMIVGRTGVNVTVQYLQVYQDSVFDLLGGDGESSSGTVRTDAAEPLNMMEEAGEVRVVGAREVHVSCAAEVMRLLDEGEQARAVANHKLNATSSRSHAILILRVAHAAGKGGDDGDGGGKVTMGKLMLVDLAGSERITKTGADGMTQKEAQAINKSLTSLGRCIQMLASGGGGHVPYRDCKLTRLLSDSLGGTALTSLIVTIGPLQEHFSETAATLKFGQQALRVENTLKVKEGVDYKLLCKQLQVKVDRILAECERLRKTTREAEDKKEHAVARMREMALAEVELSIAKAGAEREAKKARAEAEMAKARAEAEAAKAAAEANKGDDIAAIKAQMSDERVEWQQEKSEMLAINTALGDQLEGVLELLKGLNEQYGAEQQHRMELQKREREVTLREERLAQ